MNARQRWGLYIFSGAILALLYMLIHVLAGGEPEHMPVKLAATGAMYFIGGVLFLLD